MESFNLVTPLARACIKGTQEPLSELDITAALFNLVGAGSGTTASTVACALHLLALHPEVQHRAAREARAALAQELGEREKREDDGEDAGQDKRVRHGGAAGDSLACPSLESTARCEAGECVPVDPSTHGTSLPFGEVTNSGEGGGESEKAHVPGLSSLSRMPYLDSIVHETLRLCPPGALLAREATEDTVLGSCMIPKGTPVLAPIYAMHRSEKHFPWAHQFLPERFLPANQENAREHGPPSNHPRDAQGAQSRGDALWGSTSAAAYMPFGLGPRLCLGQKYAMAESKLFLAAILARYMLLPVPGREDLDLAAGINLKPRHGVLLGLCERTQECGEL